MLKNVTDYQQDNIVVGKVKVWTDTTETDCYSKFNLGNAILELREMFPRMTNIPTNSWTTFGEQVYSNGISVTCTDNGLMASSRCHALFAIPSIPWECIKSIEFDTYLHHEKFVGIWIYTTWMDEPIRLVM